MKYKFLILTLIIFVHFGYSQTHEYITISEYEFNNGEYQFKNTKKESSTVTINEYSSSIIVSRKFHSLNDGIHKTTETYYFVKKKNEANNCVRYYSVDLENKKYLEILICNEFTMLIENCSAFTECKNVTQLKK